MGINWLNLTKIAPIIQRIPCALVQNVYPRIIRGDKTHGVPSTSKSRGTCPHVHPRIYADGCNMMYSRHFFRRTIMNGKVNHTSLVVGVFSGFIAFHFQAWCYCIYGPAALLTYRRRRRQNTEAHTLEISGCRRLKGLRYDVRRKMAMFYRNWCLNCIDGTRTHRRFTAFRDYFQSNLHLIELDHIVFQFRMKIVGVLCRL